MICCVVPLLLIAGVSKLVLALTRLTGNDVPDPAAMPPAAHRSLSVA